MSFKPQWGLVFSTFPKSELWQGHLSASQKGLTLFHVVS